MLDYKVQKASFSLTPDLAPNKNFKLTPKISCNIRRAQNKLVCLFEVSLERHDEPIPFEFKISSAGVFSFDESDDINASAVKVAEATFPFVRASVSELTRLANVPPYVLPFVDMKSLIVTKNVTLTMPENLN